MVTLHAKKYKDGQEEEREAVADDGAQPSSSSGAVFDGISGARLELVCHYRCGPPGALAFTSPFGFLELELVLVSDFQSTNSLNGAQAAWQH
jgi:hypothetical protein